ncbi:MAG: DUF4407 domain-containing protein [Cyclobacteriaceae bacterium]
MDKLKHFFWTCSGASIRHLKDSPVDASKYAGIGATIFFTSLFAALAGFYALYTVFDQVWVALIFGLLWGLMIFNLDRYIVSGIRKHKNHWKSFYQVLPRVILAIIISVVIAKPLELKVFEKEINAEIILMQEEQKQLNEILLSQRFENPTQKLIAEIDLLKQEILDKQLKRDELRRLATEEADGTGGTGLRNPGPIYQIKKAEADKVEQELMALSANNRLLIDRKQQELNKLDDELDSAKKQMVDADLTGLASRMVALDRLGAKNEAIWLANLFIMLLFIVVECSPIIVKLVTEKSSYDHMVELEEYKYETEAYKRRAFVSNAMRKRAAKMSKEEEDFLLQKLKSGLNKV